MPVFMVQTNLFFMGHSNGNTFTVMQSGSLAHSYTYGLFDTQNRHTANGVVYTDCNAN